MYIFICKEGVFTTTWSLKYRQKKQARATEERFLFAHLNLSDGLAGCEDLSEARL